MAKITSEGELLTLFAQNMSDAEKCLQALATLREESGWLQVATLCHTLRQKAMAMAQMRKSSLVFPGSMGMRN